MSDNNNIQQTSNNSSSSNWLNLGLILNTIILYKERNDEGSAVVNGQFNTLFKPSRRCKILDLACGKVVMQFI